MGEKASPQIYLVLDAEFGKCEEVYSSLQKIAGATTHFLGPPIHDFLVEINAGSIDEAEKIYDTVIRTECVVKKKTIRLENEEAYQNNGKNNLKKKEVCISSNAN